MPDNLIDQARVDRRAFAVTSFAEAERADRAYWRSRTPDERLEALELCRQIAYGYDPTTRGLSRLFEVAEFPPR
jgi:hypothetical protein